MLKIKQLLILILPFLIFTFPSVYSEEPYNSVIYDSIILNGNVTEKTKIIEFVDNALKENGRFTGYGDLTCGLEILLKEGFNISKEIICTLHIIEKLLR